MIVVDTGVMLRLVVGGRAGADAARLYRTDPEWAAPASLITELRGELLGLVGDRSITADQARAMCDDAAIVLGPRIVTVPSHRVMDTAVQCGLTAGEAEFVVAARELGVKLATADMGVLRGAGGDAVWVE